MKKLDLEEKKIFLIPAPHINYYHSYRGDSQGEGGFGMDIRIMETILNQVDAIEGEGLCDGRIRISWDYGDLFWSIQLQKEYQPQVLERVIQRCQEGKDEVTIGSWGNCAKSILDTEEFRLDHHWFLENSMGIGVKQLFKGRVAPYVRTQETMFTQGMIEEYAKLGMKGLCIYYCAIPFDVSRPFLNPRLNWNQRFSPIKFNSTISDASLLFIPMYGFGDALDNLSIENWLITIRKKQEKGEIKGHAMVYLNFDMDADTWIGIKLPKLLQWMPNSGGIREIAEAIDKLDYAEFGNLIDVMPKMNVVGETELREDVADGCFNGYYNWAQKYSNTKFWTTGERARWLKCIADTVTEELNDIELKREVDHFIRDGSDRDETYLKNKLLFASTTNFGMSMPFQHPHRYKTAMNYGIRALQAANKAAKIAIQSWREKKETPKNHIIVFPITNRGISEREKPEVKSAILIKEILPLDLKNMNTIKINGQNQEFLPHAFYDMNNKMQLEALLSPELFKNKKCCAIELEEKECINNVSSELLASQKRLKNEYINIEFDSDKKICSFRFRDMEYACPEFLESAITFGKKSGKRKSAKTNTLIIERDGTDGFSAQIRLISTFEVAPKKSCKCEKTLTLYKGVPYVFVSVKMEIPEIQGKQTAKDSTTDVRTQYNMKWKEIMPCEVKPNILGRNAPLKIWKHNFMGYTSSFDLDMKEVDPENKDIDCLVANVSDGWMGVSNNEKGLVIGFDALKTANFAFSPLKIRDKGFGDLKEETQQIRINPFGTYFGRMLHYWTEGTGHAQEFSTMLATTFQSSAPTFSGKTLSFDLVLAPFEGPKPSEDIKNFIKHYSFRPLFMILDENGNIIGENYKRYSKIADDLIKEYNLEEILDLHYLEWVKKVNKDFDPSKEIVKPPRANKLRISVFLKILLDGLKDRKLKKKRNKNRT